VDRQGLAETLVQVDGASVDVLAGGAGPEVEGVATEAALEAMADVVGVVDGEAMTA
jgi:hypothetical protein